MRAEICVDTALAWRREAVEVAGGWSDRAEAFEDYALALDITALGWKATKLEGPPILMRIHPEGRVQRSSNRGGVVTDLWRTRSLAVVSFLAGRDATFSHWVHFLLHTELPAKTALYVADNSGRPDFTRMAFDGCQRIADVRGLSQVSFVSSGQAYQATPSELYLLKERLASSHRAPLCRCVSTRDRGSRADLGGRHRALIGCRAQAGGDIGYRTRGNSGVVAATYMMPYNASEVCAGYGPGGWGSMVRWEELPVEPFDVGCVGRGCAVWANRALQSYPVHLRRNELLGGDGVLCTALRQKGYRVRLHGDVRCQHNVHGRENDG